MAAIMNNLIMFEAFEAFEYLSHARQGFDDWLPRREIKERERYYKSF